MPQVVERRRRLERDNGGHGGQRDDDAAVVGRARERVVACGDVLVDVAARVELGVRVLRVVELLERVAVDEQVADAPARAGRVRVEHVAVCEDVVGPALYVGVVGDPGDGLGAAVVHAAHAAAW